jgi:hypothetical protein
VYSFEFHAQRARKAKEEVAAHGLASVADVFLRDIEGLVSSASQPHTHIDTSVHTRLTQSWVCAAYSRVRATRLGGKLSPSHWERSPSRVVGGTLYAAKIIVPWLLSSFWVWLMLMS